MPDDFDPNNIPSADDMQEAAMRALREIIAFMMLHRDEPEIVVREMERIVPILKAAIEVDGPHQPKAITIGLELNLDYWWRRNRLHEWIAVLMPLLSHALNLGRADFLTTIYRAWALCLHLMGKTGAAARALEAAADYAQDAERADLALLVRAEIFNFQVWEMSLNKAQAEARMLLDEARRLDFPYVQGRTYLSMARIYQRHGADPERIFIHAQQAFLFLNQANVPGLAAEAVNAMIGALQLTGQHPGGYVAQLFETLESLIRRTANPWPQGALYHVQSVAHYHRGQLDEARRTALLSYQLFRELSYSHGRTRATHQLGLIQTRRHCWNLAELHLKGVLRTYQALHEDTMAVNARHALAFIAVEQGDDPRALVLLQAALDAARALSPGPERDRLIELIQPDIDEVRKRLEASTQS
ncbi:MAG: hypothetical protein GX573_22140 [Chloroflexi bacterium]|nr:hypothetical protein [Chloroflexota bacterium]